MSEFFKNKTRLVMTMSIVLLVITAVAGSLAYVLEDGGLSLSLAGFSGEKVDESSEEGETGGEEFEFLVPLEGEEEADDFEVDQGPVHYNVPAEMRGTFLVAGADYLTGSSTDPAAIKKEIDAALEQAVALTMNAVIIDTSYEDGVIYHTQDAPAVLQSFDIMEYIVDGARERNLYTYAVFDASPYHQAKSPAVKLAVGAGTIDKLTVNLREFAERYRLDGILIDGYQNAPEEGSYTNYLNLGGAIGYDNFMRQTPEAVVRSASDIIRTYAGGTQVGLLADAVWANADEDEHGSNTAAAFTALGTANADTKAFVEEELVDFVAVKAYASLTDRQEPFGEVVAWWSEVALENDLPLYVVHDANKICTDEEGWQSHDQLTRQIIEAEDNSGYRGSMFNGLSRLAEDPKEATTTLIKYYNEEVQAAHILTELEVTKPEASTFTTFEPVVTFTGASDPNSPVTINGELIPTDASGYFTVTFELEAGLNSYTIEHKEKTINYAITRQVQILKDMSPMGSITTDGGMTITITATAYSDANVYATINGATVPMEIDDSVEDEQDRDSDYKLFMGEYTAPSATSEEQSLGNIVVYGSWEGHSDTIQGASVKVNKKAVVEDGVPVVVTAAQARTYPPDTLNNIPNANYFPLPKGALDYAVGDEIVYKSGNTTYTYYVLASGLRVSSGDIQPAAEGPGGNVISGMTVKADNSYTYVTLKMSEQVAYSFQYAPSGVSITFHYTGTVPGGLNLNANPLFSSAKWSGDTLTLTFIKQAAFLGYRGYFDDSGNLVLRFTNPPSSLSGAKIAIDPGHGGNDPGALGFLANYPEKVINLAIARQLADELESRGATVLLLDTSGNPSKPARVQQAENWGAHFFVSVHNNTASRSSAVGTEVYYYNSYSYPLALNASANVSKQFSTTNRGARKSHYNITLSSQFPSVLVECGFMTNKDEYEKLINSKYQARIATGIADALSATIKQMNTGVYATGEQSVGGAVSAGNDSTSAGSSSSSESSSGSPQEEITLDRSTLTLEAGQSATLTATTRISDRKVTWKSGNTSVATVDDAGRITAHKEGTAKITATDENGESAVCTVEVLEEGGGLNISGLTGNSASSEDEIYFKDKAVTLKKGKTLQLEVLSDDGKLVAADFLWESSDEDVATVDKNGKVTAMGEGQAEITAETKDGSQGIYCTVTVA